MPQHIVRAYRGFLDLPLIRTQRERVDHDRLLADPRCAIEHRIAHSRSLDETGVGCRYCA